MKLIKIKKRYLSSFRNKSLSIFFLEFDKNLEKELDILKSHFEKDKWDINLSLFLDSVYPKFLNSINGYVIDILRELNYSIELAPDGHFVIRRSKECLLTKKQQSKKRNQKPKQDSKKGKLTLGNTM